MKKFTIRKFENLNETQIAHTALISFASEMTLKSVFAQARPSFYINDETKPLKTEPLVVEAQVACAEATTKAAPVLIIGQLQRTGASLNTVLLPGSGWLGLYFDQDSKALVYGAINVGSTLEERRTFMAIRVPRSLGCWWVQGISLEFLKKFPAVYNAALDTILEEHPGEKIIDNRPSDWKTDQDLTLTQEWGRYLKHRQTDKEDQSNVHAVLTKFRNFSIPSNEVDTSWLGKQAIPTLEGFAKKFYKEFVKLPKVHCIMDINVPEIKIKQAHHLGAVMLDTEQREGVAYFRLDFFGFVPTEKTSNVIEFDDPDKMSIAIFVGKQDSESDLNWNGIGDLLTVVESDEF